MTAGTEPARAARLGRPLVWVGEVGSTNDLARLLVAAGCPEGAVVVAARQERGRGRQGRVWVSPPGGLWCSILLYPSVDQPSGLLSMAVAVAVAQTVEQFVPVPAGIQWPNDVLIAGRKVAGILIEATGPALVVGIGINVGIELRVLPPEVAARAGSLHLFAGRPIEGRAVLDVLLDRLADWYGAWAAGGQAVCDAWGFRDLLRGKPVKVLQPGVGIEGVADGIDHEGALRIRTAAGDLRRVVAGDVTCVLDPERQSW